MKWIIRWFIASIIFVAGLLGFLIYTRYGTLTFQVLEREKPEVVFNQDLVPVGVEPVNLTASLSDMRSGIDEVVIRIEQNGKFLDLFRKQYPPKVYTDSISFSFNGKDKGLKEGEAQVHISVFDKSFWNNKTENVYSAIVDYTKPRIEVLTPQHNVAVGGTELIFYRLRSSDIAVSGVKIGEVEFKGYPATALSQDFEKNTDIYFAYFALPIGFDKKTTKVGVFARDRAGNATSASFNYLVIPKKFRDTNMKLADEFLRKVFAEIIPENIKNFESLTDAEKRSAFKIVNEGVRTQMATKFKPLFANSESKQFWTAPWNRPLNAAPTSSYGEFRRYTYKDVFASSSLHAGVDLADVVNAVVKPANAGKVVYADVGGIYGNTIIIDHGFGIFSLYGHLSSTYVQVGDMVTKDTQIARSGATGLAGGDHLHFELRLQGVPITPIEWWDTNWVHEHIEKKIQWVKDQMVAQAAFEAQLQ